MNKENKLIQNLIGSLEIVLFMDKGAKRFSADIKSIKLSFLIPVLLLPLSIIPVLYAHPSESLDAGSIQVLSAIYGLRLALYLAAFTGFVYLMAKSMDKIEDFKRFVIANNWLCVPIALLGIVPITLFTTGFYSWADIYPFIIFLTLYSCACTAFMTTYIMRIPLELAVFIAITGMTIHHNALDFLKWATINALNLMA